MVALKDSKYASIRRILQRASAASKGNPRTRGILAAGDKPSLSTSGSAPDSGTYNALPSTTASAAAWTPYVAALGGWVAYNANRIFPNCVTKTLGAATGGGSADAYQGTSRIQFYVDGDAFAIALSNSTGTWRLLVDGQYEALAGHANGSATLEYWTVDFSACTVPRKVRKIEIEIPSGTTPLLFGQVYIKKADSLWPPSAEEIGPRVMIVSDSYGADANATVKGDGFTRVLGDYLGIDDVWCQGRSGAGWMRGINSDGGPNPLEAITDITSYDPDLVIYALGYNEEANNTAVVRAGTIGMTTTAAAAAATVAAVRAALPGVVQVVLGPWRAGSGTVRGRQATWDPAITAAVDALLDPYTKTITCIGLQTGSGRVGATASDGNSDYYIDTDNTHPPTVGHAYIGQWLAGKVVNALQSMLS